MNRIAAEILVALVWLCAASAQSRKRMADGSEWTTRNLNVKASPSYCYQDDKNNCRRFGRLYTWESANHACQALGEGWRLPSDAEWRRLALRYGGVSADSPQDQGKSAYRALLAGGSSGFEALLGGGRSVDGQYARLHAHGFYWTASDGVYYNFGAGGLALHRQDSAEKERAFAVRCVRD